MYLSIEVAASAACPIASTTDAGPKTTSPPVNISFTLVWKVVGSATIVFQLVTSTPLLSNNVRSELCDTATSILSNSSVNVSPVGCGLLRPLESFSPNSITENLIEFNFPFFSRFSIGFVRNLKLTPSSAAAFIS